MWPQEIRTGRYAIHRSWTKWFFALVEEVLLAEPKVPVTVKVGWRTVLTAADAGADIILGACPFGATLHLGHRANAAEGFLEGLFVGDEVHVVTDPNRGEIVGTIVRTHRGNVLKPDLVQIYGPDGEPIGYLVERGSYRMRQIAFFLPVRYELIAWGESLGTIRESFRVLAKRYRVDMSRCGGRMDPRLMLACALLVFGR